MDKPRFIIGIDPDVEKSGVAILNMESKKFVCVEAVPFTELISKFQSWFGLTKGDTQGFLVVMENSDSRTNWHLGNIAYDKRLSLEGKLRKSAAIGHGAGLCHATQRHIQELAESLEFEVVLQFPLKKGWIGPDGKITQDEIMQFIPDLPKKMNQECRDACLLAWNQAGFPIRIPASFYIERKKKKI